MELPKELQIIIDTVCEDKGIIQKRLSERTRKEEIRLTRQIIWSLCKDIFKDKYTLSYLGEMFESEHDHSTVIHAHKKVIPDKRSSNKKFDENYSCLLKKCLDLINENRENKITNVSNGDELRKIYVDVCNIKEKLEKVIG